MGQNQPAPAAGWAIQPPPVRQLGRAGAQRPGARQRPHRVAAAAVGLERSRHLEPPCLDSALRVDGKRDQHDHRLCGQVGLWWFDLRFLQRPLAVARGLAQNRDRKPARQPPDGSFSSKNQGQRGDAAIRGVVQVHPGSRGVRVLRRVLRSRHANPQEPRWDEPGGRTHPGARPRHRPQGRPVRRPPLGHAHVLRHP
ncbi:hypothetical protein D9M69_468790 [compost metagenome]